MQEAESPKDLPPYFLGSIVLIKKEELPEAEVVDGQQRLTTLTMLLATLRESVEKPKDHLTRFIYEEGNDISGTPNRYRLTLRERETPSRILCNGVKQNNRRPSQTWLEYFPILPLHKIRDGVLF